MSEVKLGKPKYEQNSKNYFSFKKDQNTFILRILPPMGELADQGKWSIYHKVEFGYTGTDNRMKPFLSPRKVNYDKMVEVESYAHVRREQTKVQLDQAEKSGNAQLVEQCKTLLQKYNQDAKHYMNAVDLQGKVGLFKIGHRGFQGLKAAIDKLRSEGIDPVGIDNGRFFVFSRSGKGRDTIYTTQEYKEKQIMNGQEVELSKPHAINESIMSKLATDAFELNNVYPSVTTEEENKIVNGGQAGVDEVFKARLSKSTDLASTPTPQTADLPTGGVATPQPEIQTLPTETIGLSVPVPSPEQPESVTTVTTNTGTTTVEINTGEVLAETPATEATVETPAAQAPAADVGAMNEADFFKMVESGKF